MIDLTILRKNIDKELKEFIISLQKEYELDKVSPELYSAIKNFVLRDGKRIRPLLYLVGFMGYSKKEERNLYKSAISIELLHDFMLIHDDVIDKSDKRRGKPTLHVVFNKYLKRFKNAKTNGNDLAIVAGDVIYALAIKSFLSIGVNLATKEKALRRFADTSIYTGSGQFLELINTTKKLSDVSKQDIYKVYDYKTAYYTFANPLVIGATLAKAPESEINNLSKFGLYLGRAFQIKDDIIGIFGDERKTGKSVISDIKEGKRTILLWHAYNKSSSLEKKKLSRLFDGKKISLKEIKNIKAVIAKRGSKDFAEKEVSGYYEKAKILLKKLKMAPDCKELLITYLNKILST